MKGSDLAPAAVPPREALDELLADWRAKAAWRREAMLEANHASDRVMDAYHDGRSMSYAECADDLEMWVKRRAAVRDAAPASPPTSALLVEALKSLRWSRVLCGACGFTYCRCTSCGQGTKGTVITAAQCSGHSDTDCSAACIVDRALRAALEAGRTPVEPEHDPSWRLEHPGEAGLVKGEHGSWVETDHPAVVGCMGTEDTPCRQNGCQYQRALEARRTPVEPAQTSGEIVAAFRAAGADEVHVLTVPRSCLHCEGHGTVREQINIAGNYRIHHCQNCHGTGCELPAVPQGGDTSEERT